MSGYNFSELTRIVHNLAQRGVISAVDNKKHLVKVKVGDNESDWLPSPADIGRNYTRHIPMKVGISVGLLCPKGDLAQAFIVSVMYDDNNNSPSQSDSLDVWQFSNGTRIEHNNASGQTTITNAVVVVNEGDVIVNGISFINHVHKDVKAGSSNTGKPA